MKRSGTPAFPPYFSRLKPSVIVVRGAILVFHPAALWILRLVL